MTLRPLPLSPAALRYALLWRVYRVAMVLSGLIALIFGFNFWRLGREALAATEWSAGLLLAMGYGVARHRDDPTLGLELLGVVLWGLFTMVIWLQGGLNAPAIAWIVLLPPLLMFVSMRLSMALSVATVAYMGLLYVADVSGWLPTYAPPPLVMRAITAGMASVLFALFTWYALRWRERLAAALEVARDEANEANQLKDRFIANLNHEIRTPLNALVAGASLLSSHNRDPEQRAMAQAMQRSAVHLLGLVNDVLDHARLESGEVSVEARAFSLRQLTRSVIEMFSALAQSKQLSLRLELPDATHDTWVGDATRLLQVLSNLVSNALKFTPAGGCVTVAVSLPTVSDGRSAVAFEVRDTGPGITPEVQARLFRPYEQGDISITRRFGGTGLGLSICKELLRLMGGHIEVHSQPGAGAIFRACVPMVQAQASQIERVAPVAPAGLGADMHVLLVEDDAINRMVMQAVLTNFGAQVSTAETGREALARLESKAFDLVLMDCQMPDMDGLTATRRWREREAMLGRARVPIVALTGDVHEQARTECLAAGMDDHLTKPASAEALHGTLRQWAAAKVAGELSDQ